MFRAFNNTHQQTFGYFLGHCNLYITKEDVVSGSFPFKEGTDEEIKVTVAADSKKIGPIGRIAARVGA